VPCLQRQVKSDAARGRPVHLFAGEFLAIRCGRQMRRAIGIPSMVIVGTVVAGASASCFSKLPQRGWPPAKPNHCLRGFNGMALTAW